MKEFELKYGCNPNQKPARIFMEDGRDLPVEIVNGRPGYINFLDAFNSWQLVKELKEATGECCATSFKHVSPTSAALGRPLGEKLKKACFADDVEGLDDSPVACAYARARGTDRMSSFGDWIALSDECDATCAKIIAREVSDGIIAPGYTPEALEILKAKRKGAYNIVKVDPLYVPAPVEHKQVFGVTFEQGRNNFEINRELLANVVTEKKIPHAAETDLIVALITLKYTQSNSVAFAEDGQAIGVGAGQQSICNLPRAWADPKRTTSSTSISPTSARTSSARTCGGSILPSVPKSSRGRKRERISTPSPASLSAPMPSSPLTTTSCARQRAACPMSQSPAAPCATI